MYYFIKNEQYRIKHAMITFIAFALGKLAVGADCLGINHIGHMKQSRQNI